MGCTFGRRRLRCVAGLCRGGLELLDRRRSRLGLGTARADLCIRLVMCLLRRSICFGMIKVAAMQDSR